MNLSDAPSLLRPREAILLVAGTGSRLHPYTLKKPKCLLEVGGSALLERLLRQLETLEIGRVVLVTGFQNEFLMDTARGYGLSIELEEAFCPTYDMENNAVSLLTGMKALKEKSFLLCDGDILLKEVTPLRGLLTSARENELATIAFENLGAEEMKVEVGPDEKVLFLSKDLDPEGAHGESLGIQKIGPSIFEALMEQLEAMNQEERIRLYYEDLFSELIKAGAQFFAASFPSDCWTEIDTAEDLEKARQMARQWDL